MNKLWMPLLLMGCGLTCALGAAEFKEVPDPTRPAAGFRASGTAGTSGGWRGSKPDAGAPGSAVASAAEPAKPMLQGIRMDLLGGKAVAMIGDELVSVGDRVGGATVVAITRSEVTLRDQRGLHKMQMDEGVSMVQVREDTRKGSAHKAEATPEEARKPALKKSRRKETS